MRQGGMNLVELQRVADDIARVAQLIWSESWLWPLTRLYVWWVRDVERSRTQAYLDTRRTSRRGR